ncbi:DNA replication protein psf1 [Thecaphora frezii]
MFGDQANKLVTEAKAAQTLGSIRPYNDELTRLVLLETRQLHAHLSTLLSTSDSSDPSVAAQLVTHHLSAYRNKRCLLAYHASRLDMLQSLLWKNGANLSQTLDDDGTRHKLSPAEIDYAKKYRDLVNAYKGEFLDVLDLMAPLEKNGREEAGIAGAAGEWAPPLDLMVTVVALRDASDVQTETGSISLRKGERMRVKRSEVEALIVRRWVEVVDDGP